MKSDLTTVSVKSGNLSDKVATPTIQTDRPNQLWIPDFRHVSTWQGWCMGPLSSTYLLGMGIPVNRHRLHEPIGYISLAEAEVNYYQQLAEKTVVNI